MVSQLLGSVRMPGNSLRLTSFA